MRIREYIIASLFPFLLGISTHKKLNSQEISASAYFGVERENVTKILSPGNIQNGYFTRFDKAGLEAIVIPNITTEPDNVEFRVEAPAGLDIRTDGERIWSEGPVGNEHISIRYIMEDKNTGAYTFIDLSGEADSLIWRFTIDTDQEDYYGLFSHRYGTDVIAPIFGGIPDSVSTNKEDNPYQTFLLLDSISNIEETNPIENKEGIGFRNLNGQQLREVFDFYAHGNPGENLYFGITIMTDPIITNTAKEYKVTISKTEDYDREINFSNIRLLQFFPDTVYYAEENNPGARIEDGAGGDGMFYPVDVICQCDTLYESHTTPSHFNFDLDRMEHEAGDSLWRLWYLAETDYTAPIEKTTFWFSPYPVGIQGEEDNYASMPRTIELNQNYPNPFNPSTTISYSLPQGQGYDKTNVSLKIHDARGRLVRTLEDSVKEPGDYSVTWNGLNEYGMPCGSGVYLYDLIVSHKRTTRKMTLVK